MKCHIRLYLAVFLAIIAGSVFAAPEKSKVAIAVGGKAALFYLPLTIAERLGYFKDEGLEVEISDFPGGAKALQAMMGGSADVVAGGFDHVIHMNSKGQNLQAFVAQLATPAMSLGIAKQHAGRYKSPKDLKGMKIGVSAPGSSTHLFLSYLLSSVGLSNEDVSIIGVGTGATAVAGVRTGQLDAIVNVEPAITALERAGDIAVVVETISAKGSNAVYGATLPSGCLYTKREFVQKNPNTVQALANAMVKALTWLKKASSQQIIDTVPPEFIMGDKSLYLAALERSRQSFSPDGLISPQGAQSLYEVLRKFDPNVKAAAGIKISDTFDNGFAMRAAGKR
ncbi:MAG: transporter substrate-binding domain-containing protein [Betaproteobacteria bacterium]|nr:transporter substrate-binding domain-containing protein [Betaproteobacteria bacterium]